MRVRRFLRKPLLDEHSKRITNEILSIIVKHERIRELTQLRHVQYTVLDVLILSYLEESCSKIDGRADIPLLSINDRT